MLVNLKIILIVFIGFKLNQIRFLKTPRYSDLNDQLNIFNIVFEIEFNLNWDNIKNDITLKLDFPDLLTNDFNYYWVKGDFECNDFKRLIKGTSMSNSVEGNKVKYLILKDFKTSKINKLYIEIHLKEFPGVAGYKNPIYLFVVLDNSEYSQILAYNYKDLIIYKGSNVTDSIAIDFTPNNSITESTQINRKYIALVDVTLTKDCDRIQIKSSNFNFSIDSLQNCNFIFISGTTENINKNNYECIFDFNLPTLLTYITKNNYKFPKNKKLRMTLPLNNPNLPGTNGFIFMTKEKYSPLILETKIVNSALNVQHINFKEGNPSVFLGPNLNVKSNNFPNLNLFTMGQKENAIILNSIEISFTPEINIPEPTDNHYYYLKVIINGSSNTILLPGFIYNNFPKIRNSNRIIQEIDSSNSNIIFRNIGGLSSFKTYNIGFKIGLHGDENLKIEWGGADDFLGIQLLHSQSNAVIIGFKAPINLNANFKIIKNVSLPTIIEAPTITHSLPSGSADSLFANRGLINFGVEKKNNLDFFIKSNLNPLMGFTHVNNKSYLEFITNIYIENDYNLSNWDGANYSEYCFLRNNLGALKTNSITNCIFFQINRGIVGEELNILRIGASNSGFWANSTQDHFFGFKKVKITKNNNFYKDDSDSTILDLYINVYSDIGTNNYKNNSIGTPNLVFLDNIVVLNNNVLSQTNIKLINYLRETSMNFDYKKIPNFIKVEGILNQIQSDSLQNLIIFFEDIEPLFIDSENYEIGCSNASVKNYLIKCFYFKGNNGRACTSSKTCKNIFLKDRIEIQFSSYLISNANAFEVSLLIPIYFKMGAHSNFNFEIGTGKFMSSGFNQFVQITEYKKLSPVVFPTNSPATLASIETSTVDINNINFIKNKIVFPDSNLIPFISQKFDSKFDIDCDSASNNECLISNSSEEYSFTFCQDDENFMSKDFDVINTEKTFQVPLIYLNCIKNITYTYTNAGSNYKKYCLWCPIRKSGTQNDFRLFKNFIAQPNGYLKWKSNTYSALSGVYPNYGLVSLTNISLFSTRVFKTNNIFNISVTPRIVYKETKSIKFTLDFNISTDLKNNNYIFIKCNQLNPFTFIKTNNNHCNIYNEFHKQKINCIVTITGLEIKLQLLDNISKGNIVINIYGINILNIATGIINFQIITSTIQSTDQNYYWDISNKEAFELSVNDYPDISFRNKILINNIIIDNLDKNAITRVEFKIVWGNNKNLYMNEKIEINFGAAAYNNLTYNSICNVYNENNFLDTNIVGCNSNNLASLYFFSNKDTNTNSFKIIITNFRMFDGNSKISAKLLSESNTNYVQTQDSQLFDFFTSISYSPINTLSIVKKLNYIYINPIYEIDFTSNLNDLDNTSRLGIKFPIEYGDFLDNLALECYYWINNVKVTLLCSYYNEFLYISGFKNIVKNSPAIKINLIGIKQPKVISNSEILYVTFDTGDSPNILESKRLIIQNSSSLGAIPLINFQNIEFKNKFIREKSDIDFIFKNINIFNSLTFVGIILDFLEIDYINYTNPLDCKLLVNEQNIASNCERFGNFIKIQISQNINPDTLVRIKLNNIINPEKGGCDIKYPTIFNYNSGFSIISVSLGIFLNVKSLSLSKDPLKTYINWVTDNENNVSVKMGIYNKIRLKVDKDWVFDQDIYLFWDSKYDSKLSTLRNSVIENIDSYIGSKYYPMYIGSKIKESSYGKYLIEVKFNEIYPLNKISKIPIIPLLFKKQKIKINIPKEILVYRGYESLPINVKFDEPFVEEIKFSVYIQSSVKFTNFEIKDNISIWEFGPWKSVNKFVIKSKHNIIGNQIFQENTKLVIRPLNNTIYDITESMIILKDLTYNLGNNFNLTWNNSNFSLKGNIKTDSAIVLIYYILPEILFQTFDENKVLKEFYNSNFTSNYLFLGIKNFDKTLAAKEFNICNNCLVAGEKYIFKYFKKSIFEFLNVNLGDIPSINSNQNITNNTISISSNITSNSSNNTASNITSNSSITSNSINISLNNNLTVSSSNITNNSSSSNSTVNKFVIPNFLGMPTFEKIKNNFDLDNLNFENLIIKETKYLKFNTETNRALMGSFRITFSEPLRKSVKLKLLCYTSLYLGYSFENLWSEDDLKCDGRLKTRDDVINELRSSVNITSSNSSLLTNTSSLSTNTSLISTNTSTISTNTSTISTNTSTISTNTSTISTNTSTISTNTSTISTNTSNISSNSASTNNSTLSSNSTSSSATNELDIKDPLDNTPIVNILLMRNNHYNQNPTQFLKLNSLISSKNYKIYLKNNIENLPNIKLVSILISNQNSEVIINNHFNIEIFSNKTGITVNKLSLKSKGSVFFYLIENNFNDDRYINYHNIREAKLTDNLNFGNGIYGKKLNVYNITSPIEFSIHNLKVDKFYKLYYYLINQDKGIFAKFTPIYKINFVIRGKNITVIKDFIYCCELILFILLIIK